MIKKLLDRNITKYKQIIQKNSLILPTMENPGCQMFSTITTLMNHEGEFIFQLHKQNYFILYSKNLKEKNILKLFFHSNFLKMHI